MLPTQLAELLGDDPAGAAEALDLVTGLDRCLERGFARLGDEGAAALAAVAGALAATPLGDAAAVAAAKLTAGSVDHAHLLLLAGARSALLGALADALLAGFDSATGRARSPWEGPAPLAGGAGGPLVGCRSWLDELAITGWRGVDHDLVASAEPTIQALLAEPAWRRLAVLVDGLAAELGASCPVGALERLPLTRWADLWARAMLLAEGPAATPVGTVSGRLLPLGVDLQAHATAFQAQVHAVLEPAGGGQARLVRISVGAAKVDTIVGPSMWRLLDDHRVLLAALADRRAIDVDGLPIGAGGDLHWRDAQVTLGPPADPFATARVQLAAAVAPSTAPLERHPVAIAEPVLVEGYTVTSGPSGGLTLEAGDQGLPVDTGRLSSCGPLTPAVVAASSACIGLLRWDDGWRLQPLAVLGTGRRRGVAVHAGDWAMGPTDPKVAKAVAKLGDPVAVLRERAGRLLRK